MRITQLTQPTKYSCVSTCLAMLAGHTCPNEIVAKYHPIFWNGDMNTYQMMDDIGIKYRLPQKRNRNRLRPGKTFLVTVPSLNITGGMHQVIFQVTKEWVIIVHDPAVGREGRKFYSSTHKIAPLNAEYPISWEIDAEILGIEMPKVTKGESRLSNSMAGDRQTAFRYSHDSDFEEFLHKNNLTKGDNYDLAS